jgi:hypothetical protein
MLSLSKSVFRGRYLGRRWVEWLRNLKLRAEGEAGVDFGLAR